jgi:5-methyltetrahydrofolate--homocysteine methyltransferase
MAIINPSTPRYRDVVEVCKIISGQDKSAAQYIETCQNTPDPYDAPKSSASTATEKSKNDEGKIASAPLSTSKEGCPITIPTAFKHNASAVEEICNFILAGRTSNTAKATEVLIKDYSPLDIIDGIFIPTLDEVGARFEDGRFFLPQLLSAAEAVSAGFDVVEAAMGEAAPRSEDKTIVLATVKGDIHDIGKNIVAMLLRNYGYNVIDLGRDVAPETVIEAARAHSAGLIGLSALMTTTVKSMEETIRLAKTELPDIPIMVGGAVLTPEYSDMIGADYYSKDAAESARIAAEIFA